MQLGNSAFDTSGVMGRRRAWLMLAALTLAAGCASPPIDPSAWGRVEMASAEVAPNLNPTSVSRRTRVIVIPAVDPPGSRAPGVADAATAALESLLSKGGIEVVDRRLAGRLDEELRLAEVRTGMTCGGPDIADYAISISLGNSEFASKFVPASTYKDYTGKVHVDPASHTHAGETQMTLRLVQLPSLRLVHALPAFLGASRSEQARPITLAEGQQLMRGAAGFAVEQHRVQLLNELTPKGYVLERRVNPKRESMFRVMLGQQTGARPGHRIQFITLQRNVNPLTGSVTHDQVTIGIGVMTNVVGDSECWVRVDSEPTAMRIRRGDVAKVILRKSLFEL